MHPMFVMLFIETDADELLTQERDKRRRARSARRLRSAQAVRVPPVNRDRPRRP
jgi:hypothetical protein